MVLPVLAAVLAAVSVAATAQELVTDRPDQTESAVTVPSGHWQLEAGWTFVRDDEPATRTAVQELPGALLRVGLSSDWELRLGWAGLVREESAAGPRLEGAGDGELGAKVLLREAEGAVPDVALLFGTSIPLGDGAFSSHRFDPSLRLSLAHDLSERVSLGYNLGMEWATVPDEGGDGRDSLSRGLYTIALGIGISERAAVFAELFGDFAGSAGGSPASSFDGGLTWLLRDNLQLDLAAGFALSSAADPWFVGAGVSLRMPR